MTTRSPFALDRLTRSQKFAYARQAVAAQMRDLPGFIATRFGAESRNSALHLNADPPDSACTREALAMAEDVYDPVLFNHCLRCWYFADLFAQLEHARYDPEVLYTACLLHDIGLTARHRTDDRRNGCFAIHGGHLAAQAMSGWGASDRSARLVDQAIAAHMNVTVAANEGIEAHLLHAATHLDVAGARAREMPRSLIRQVNTDHPRTGFAASFTAAMRLEGHDHPDSRTAVLWKLGMQLPIRLNPLEHLD